MRRALDLARLGLGQTAPNPAVGCVVLDAGGQVRQMKDGRALSLSLPARLNLHPLPLSFFFFA
jgi:hypothetical protein